MQPVSYYQIHKVDNQKDGLIHRLFIPVSGNEYEINRLIEATNKVDHTHVDFWNLCCVSDFAYSDDQIELYKQEREKSNPKQIVMKLAGYFHMGDFETFRKYVTYGITCCMKPEPVDPRDRKRPRDRI